MSETKGEAANWRCCKAKLSSRRMITRILFAANRTKRACRRRIFFLRIVRWLGMGQLAEGAHHEIALVHERVGEGQLLGVERYRAIML